MKNFKFIVKSSEENNRVDKFLSSKLVNENISRNKIKKAIENQKMKINDVTLVTSNYLINVDDKIEIIIEQENNSSNLEANKIDFEVVYEDKDVMVINKPNDLVVHPGAGNKNNTLVNGLIEYNESLKDVGNKDRPGLVHRIDKQTTGLLLIAKNDESIYKLQKDLRLRKIKRRYLVLVHGQLKATEGKINAPIGRSRKNRLKQEVTEINSKHAITNYKRIKLWQRHTLIECDLETGRTHQIRAHMEYIKHPIVGDYLYGSKELDSFGQYLHAYKLSFVHPKNNKKIDLEIDLPKEFKNKIDELDKNK